MSRNSRLYSPFDTLKARLNDDFIHIPSFGDVLPDIDTSSPCSATSGAFNSVTLALAVAIVAMLRSTQSNNMPARCTKAVCFIFISVTFSIIKALA